jgi:hypothetical protein
VTSRNASLLLCVGVAVAASSCVTMETPKTFLVIDRGTAELKATTPDDDRLWVRTFDDDVKGDLSFWRDALKNDLVKNRGYTLLSEGTATDASGAQGAELVLEATVDGRAYQELVALFVYEGALGNTIRVVEFVAEKDRFAAQLDDVRASVRTMKR